LPHLSRSRLLRRSAVAALVAGAGLAGTAASASAQNVPFIQHWAAFSGGHVGDYTVGTVIETHFVDPTGTAKETEYCWSPAPIARPACSTSTAGAPAQAGTQTVTAKLSNGQSVSTTFPVGPANVNLGTGNGPFVPPVPYTLNGGIVLSADASLDEAIATLSPGQQVAGYYSPRQGVTQVYDYATNQAGFVPSALLDAPAATDKTYKRTVTLRSNRTRTYRLKVPAGFEPNTSRNPGGGRQLTVDYQIYYGQVGSGVANPIRTSGRGAHEPFLGATVTRSSFKDNTVSVTVKTGKLSKPLKLQLSAYGTA
jgi:hypothetical protein